MAKYNKSVEETEKIFNDALRGVDFKRVVSNMVEGKSDDRSRVATLYLVVYHWGDFDGWDIGDSNESVVYLTNTKDKAEQFINRNGGEDTMDVMALNIDHDYLADGGYEKDKLISSDFIDPNRY